MYNPLRNKTHYSVQKGLSKPYQLAHRAYQIGATAVAINDLESISGCVEFQTACKETCKCGKPKKAHPNQSCEKYEAINIKSILGSELHCFIDDMNVNVLIISKNRDGWNHLLKIFNRSHGCDTVTLQSEDFDENLIYIVCPPDNISDNEEEFIIQRLKLFANKCNSICYFGISLYNLDNNPRQQKIADITRKIAQELNIKTVALNNSYYTDEERSNDHRVLLCVGMKTKFSKVEVDLLKPANNQFEKFFRSNKYYIPTSEEVQLLYTQEELDNTVKIGELCDNYDITNQPMFPIFQCPNNESHDDYLRQLCRDGWKKKIANKIPKDNWQKYIDQVKFELDVFAEFKISTYMLVVADYVNWAKSQGILVGVGRGSAASSLVSYLTNITEIDPIEYQLIFSRFLNKSRLMPKHTSFEEFSFNKFISSV